MLPNHPYNNLSYFSNETTPRFPMQTTLIGNYQIQPSETPSQGDSSSCPTRKRPSRSDRHSKIRTAQGERDRRMRLSVQVASEFFALQDRLGFDKASQTLDWLLTEAKESIDQIKASSELPREEQAAPSNGPHHRNSTISDQIHSINTEKLKNVAPSTQSVSKESRDKARLRARERAKEKKNSMNGKVDELEVATVVSPYGETDVNSGSELEYYYYLTEILNGNLEGCGMEFEDQKVGFMPGLHFN